ncbi:MAG: hypothetical protein IPM34_13265 [Saprospiraceae bacterium]|nr:hypothetical protein [Saprospiraceae bacterium]
MFTNVVPIHFLESDPDVGIVKHWPRARRIEIPNTFYYNHVDGLINSQADGSEKESKFSLNNFLIEGLKGMADENGDKVVKLKEMDWFFKNIKPQPGTAPGFLSISCSQTKHILSKTDLQFLSRINNDEDRTAISILDTEELLLDPLTRRSLPDSFQRVLEDYLVVLNLRHLMSPPEKKRSDDL